MKEEMNNKNRLKIIFRPFLPETNSSSSHSLVITQGTPYILPGNPLWDVPTDPLTGKLKIAGYASFGRGAGVYNSVYSKIQYTAAALCYWSRTERASHEGLLRLERIIKDITGIPGVTWEWIPDYYKRLFTAYQDPREFMKYGEEEEFGWPDVDHEGTDRFPEVLEQPLKRITDAIIIADNCLVKFFIFHFLLPIRRNRYQEGHKKIILLLQKAL